MTDRLDPDQLDSWWDFADPEGTLVRFERALDSLPDDSVARAELVTQVARAHGLTGDPSTAADLLEPLTSHPYPAVRGRVLLEQGRLLRSAGSPEAAVPLFLAAAELAGPETFLLVDALHMLALADPDHADRWTGNALTVVAGSADARVRRWAGALHNNLGWSHFDRGDLTEALRQFEAALATYRDHGTPFQVHVARWAVGRALRELGRIDEALAIQLDLAARDAPDGHVEVELAALARLRGRDAEAADHEARAAALLA